MKVVINCLSGIKSRPSTGNCMFLLRLRLNQIKMSSSISKSIQSKLRRVSISHGTKNQVILSVIPIEYIQVTSKNIALNRFGRLLYFLRQHQEISSLIIYQAKLLKADWLRGARLILNLQGKICNSAC